MRTQNLIDSDYSRNAFYAHRRGWLNRWSWEYSFAKSPLDPIVRFVLTLGGDDCQSVRLSIGLLGLALYLKFPRLLPERFAIGWFSRGLVKNPRWHDDSMGRSWGFYWIKEALSFEWGRTVAASGRDAKKYGRSWYFRNFWSWDGSVRWDVLKTDGTWGPCTYMQKQEAARKARKEGRKIHYWQLKDEDFPDHALIQRVAYCYELRSGEIQMRHATFHVYEQEWRWLLFRWLPFRFGPKLVVRCIDVTFDKEVGEQAGSWKGGVTGTSNRMLPGETSIECLRRMEREVKF